MTAVPVPLKYGSKEMRQIFEEETYFRFQLLFESTVADSQAQLGLIPKKAAIEINSKANLKNITVKRWREIEKITHHETASLVESIVEVVNKEAKPWVHYGLTSNDVLDTTLSLQLKNSIEIIEKQIVKAVKMLGKKALKYQDLPAVGRTHGQHASIISFGLKFAVWSSEIMRHSERLQQLKERALVCKTLGVVGTGSVMGTKALKVQALTAKKLGLKSIEAATQVVPRDILAEVLFFGALVASSLEKIAIEIRNLQRTEISEMEEAFGTNQIGSSAVPTKRNPIKCERISSLAKFVRVLPDVALQNIPLWHERDLSNSANERMIVPQSFVLLDEMIQLTINVLDGLIVNTDSIKRNLDLTREQIFSEFIMDALIKKGIPRSRAHELLRKAALKALTEKIRYSEAILVDKKLGALLDKKEISKLFKPQRCLAASKEIIANVVKHVESL
jgi:adenylosuccinate lyase